MYIYIYIHVTYVYIYTRHTYIIEMHVSCSTSPFRQRTRHLPHAAEPLRRKRVTCRSSDGFGTGTPGASADAAERYQRYDYWLIVGYIMAI